MEIDIKKVYFFQARLNTPIFYGHRYGITTEMENDTTIETLTIAQADLFFNINNRSTMLYTIKPGGKDSRVLNSEGKLMYDYMINLNLPLTEFNKNDLYKLIGIPYRVVIENIKGEKFAIFAPFRVKPIKFNNDIMQRISLEANDTHSGIFKVNDLVISSIVKEPAPCIATDEEVGLDCLLDCLLT